MAKKQVKRKRKKKEKKVVTHGIMYVHSNFNNTIITITDKDGNVLNWMSSGVVGFKGSKKSTPFAAQIAAERALTAAAEFGIKTLDIKVKGPGSGRDSAVRSVASTDFKVLSIRDITPIPHNGCRPRKKRRV
jgi:small subunit ribosomal protein S11